MSLIIPKKYDSHLTTMQSQRANACPQPRSPQPSGYVTSIPQARSKGRARLQSASHLPASPITGKVLKQDGNAR